MTALSTRAPFARTKENREYLALDMLVAIAPVLVWAVFMFGARVITLCVVGAASALALDFPIQRFVFKRAAKTQIDPIVCVYAILSVFAMPVSVPLWFPTLSAILVVAAKNIYVFRKKRLFNPFVFSAAVLNLVFPKIMTAFTKPFAYFSAFDISIDPVLLDHYRVLSPLQYMADGSVYEDGVLAQLYGFASGHIGEIAVAAMILSAVWLIFRKALDPASVSVMLISVLILALIFPSDDAESSYYAFSVLFSGATVFLSVFALGECTTVPITKLGKAIFGLACGILLFVSRKVGNGVEWGYLVVLLLNIASPFIEKYTQPKILNEPKTQKKFLKK